MRAYTKNLKECIIVTLGKNGTVAENTIQEKKYADTF